VSLDRAAALRNAEKLLRQGKLDLAMAEYARGAVEWLERAAEAPPSTAHQAHRLLYELAQALEATGETARALAICIELQADAGDFRDVAARVDHLAKAQARG
jgi:hypothetical protein